MECRGTRGRRFALTQHAPEAITGLRDEILMVQFPGRRQDNAVRRVVAVDEVDQILARMRDAAFKPDGMQRTIEQILAE